MFFCFFFTFNDLALPGKESLGQTKILQLFLCLGRIGSFGEDGAVPDDMFFVRNLGDD